MKKPKPIRVAISTERALQLSNDLAENIASGNVREWRAVALYWQDRFNRLSVAFSTVQPTVAALLVGYQTQLFALKELEQWNKTHRVAGDDQES